MYKELGWVTMNWEVYDYSYVLGEWGVPIFWQLLGNFHGLPSRLNRQNYGKHYMFYVRNKNISHNSCLIHIIVESVKNTTVICLIVWNFISYHKMLLRCRTKEDLIYRKKFYCNKHPNRYLLCCCCSCPWIFLPLVVVPVPGFFRLKRRVMNCSSPL